MFCHNCGSKALENGVYCENCGSKLLLDDQQSPAISDLPVQNNTIPDFFQSPYQDITPDQHGDTSFYNNQNIQQQQTSPVNTYQQQTSTVNPYQQQASTANQYSQQYQDPFTNQYNISPANQPAKKKGLYILLSIGGIVIIGLVIALIMLLRDSDRSGDRNGYVHSPEQSPVSELSPVPVEEPVNTPHVDNNIPENNDENTPEATLISVDEARVKAQTWLIANPIYIEYLLDSDYSIESYRGVEYFRFYMLEPSYYWFSILVHKETGDLYCMLIEDGMDPAPPHVEPLDDWYNNVFRRDDDVSPISDLFNATETYGSHISLIIAWDAGDDTVFLKNGDFDWIMHSRDGGVRDVIPSFTLRGAVLEIRFPTTTRFYSLYDDHTGSFGDESFRWGYMIS